MSAALLLAGLRLLDPETAHRLTIWGLAKGLAPAAPLAPDPRLKSHLFGLDFAHPVGLAAGFDKDAEVPDALTAVGFSFVEVGTLTPQPQAGNPRPRVFRLPADGAVINRYGFNNQGLEAAKARLAGRPSGNGILGINVGANKTSAAPIEDYRRGIIEMAPLADYLTVNVSSPNTPGLRDLQAREHLTELLAVVAAARGEDGPPVLLKIAPDLSQGELENIVEVAVDGGVDGLIVSNTTVHRPANLRGRHRGEAGGLSGRPLRALATAVLAAAYRLVDGRIPLIGVGGIASGADAYARIRAGASLVQLYTALIYNGPGLVATIVADLAALLARDGFDRLSQAVGVDAAAG